MMKVRECALLKIEDILPLFPENTLIDDFREENTPTALDFLDPTLWHGHNNQMDLH